MDFTGDIALWQRRVAHGPEGKARRRAAAEALTIETGHALLDLGCGGGYLVQEFALAVGRGGRAVGLDVSAEQLTAAREICNDLPAVELVEGNATDMIFADAAFDGLASIQTLEYVADVDAALAEVRRVLKPGGKAALISVLWDHFCFHGAAPDLNDRIMDVFRAHCPHQMLPLEMPRRLKSTGFGGVMRKPIVFFNGSLHENAYGYWVAKIVAAFAIGQGVSETDASLWLDQLDEASKEGRFGFISIPVLTTATAI